MVRPSPSANIEITNPLLRSYRSTSPEIDHRRSGPRSRTELAPELLRDRARGSVGSRPTYRQIDGIADRTTDLLRLAIDLRAHAGAELRPFEQQLVGTMQQLRHVRARRIERIGTQCALGLSSHDGPPSSTSGT